MRKAYVLSCREIGNLGVRCVSRGMIARQFAEFILIAAAACLACFAQSGTFQQVPGSLSQISVGADGTVWGLNSSQQIFTYDSASGQFVQVPGSLTQIAVGNAQAVWGINAQEQIYRWDAGAGSWTNVPGSLKYIGVGAEGDVWGSDLMTKARSGITTNRRGIGPMLAEDSPSPDPRDQ